MFKVCVVYTYPRSSLIYPPDHILTLQHSLAHYERMLSQSHPVYLLQLRTSVALTKQATDKSIIFLTVVSIAVLCIQTLIGESLCLPGACA